MCVLKKAVGSRRLIQVEAPGRSRYLGQEPILEQSVPEGQQPIERTHTTAVCEGHEREKQHQDKGLAERSS